MMNNKEKAEVKYVITRLNEIYGLTHRIKLNFDQDEELVKVFKVYNISATATTDPLLVINVKDDSALAVFEDVYKAINDEFSV